MNYQPTPLQIFENEAPDVARTFNRLPGALKHTSGLYAETMQLVYIGIPSAFGESFPVKYHSAMVRAPGASRDESRDTALITMAYDRAIKFGLYEKYPVAY